MIKTFSDNITSCNEYIFVSQPKGVMEYFRFRSISCMVESDLSLKPIIFDICLFHAA